MLSDTDKKQIVRQIDADAWNHSWHLPSSPYGIKWDSSETLLKVRDVLVEQIAEAQQRLRDADRILRVVVAELIDVQKQEAALTYLERKDS